MNAVFPNDIVVRALSDISVVNVNAVTHHIVDGRLLDDIVIPRYVNAMIETGGTDIMYDAIDHLHKTCIWTDIDALYGEAGPSFDVLNFSILHSDVIRRVVKLNTIGGDIRRI